MSSVSSFNDIHEIIPNLFLTNYQTAKELLHSENPSIKMTHLLTVADELDLSEEAASKKIVYRQIPADDYNSFDLQKYFHGMTSFIHKCLTNQGTIVVHCLMGVSRSAATVMAYLIRFKNLTTEEALLAVKEKRMVSGPNQGFMMQLKRYEEQLRIQEESKRLQEKH